MHTAFTYAFFFAICVAIAPTAELVEDAAAAAATLTRLVIFGALFLDNFVDANNSDSKVTRTNAPAANRCQRLPSKMTSPTNQSNWGCE